MITPPDFSELGSLAFEYLTCVRCGENPDINNYLAKIESKEAKRAFLSLVEVAEVAVA